MNKLMSKARSQGKAFIRIKIVRAFEQGWDNYFRMILQHSSIDKIFGPIINVGANQNVRSVGRSTAFSRRQVPFLKVTRFGFFKIFDSIAVDISAKFWFSFKVKEYQKFLVKEYQTLLK